MSLFDRIAQSLDKMLSRPDDLSFEDEQGHIDLLEQSSNRLRETLEAIKQGNLVAASSTTEDWRATHEMRYQDLVQAPRPHASSLAGRSQDKAASMVERIRNTSGSTLQR